jgi:hypothetical protein
MLCFNCSNGHLINVLQSELKHLYVESSNLSASPLRYQQSGT